MCSEEDFKKAVALTPKLKKLFQYSPDPEDGVQETLLRLFLHQGEVHNVRNYVFTIARNVRYEQFSRRRLFLAPLIDDPPSHHNTEQLADRELAQARLLAAIASIRSPKRREVYLGWLQGESYDELAARIGVSASMIKKHLRMARQELFSKGIPRVED